MTRSSRIAALLALFATPAFAGGTPENALLIVDPSNAESLHVANYYKEARDLPDANVIYMAPNPGSYSAFAASTLPAFTDTIDMRGLSDHIDYVVIPPGGPFFLSAGGMVSDMCFPVNRFSTTAPYTMAFSAATIQAGVASSFSNGYYRNDDLALAFDSNQTWFIGQWNDSLSAKRHYIGAMLGYTGPLGNTLAEVLAMIDRSVAVDGTQPAGTVYYMQTTDFARSSPRHGLYPSAVASLTALGHPAQHLFADLPIGHHDALGIMTGLAAPDIDNANLSLLPGSFADHLTSYAATFDEGSQTKMSRWISKGASGTSGAVEEPCNYSGKFPRARMHVFYAKGLSLGEAWLRSMQFAPFQTLFTGDPLTRPFAHIPSVALSGVPAGLASSTVVLTPSATTTHPTAQIASFDLLVDGRTHAAALPGGTFSLDTTQLADGWHELRAVAYDDTDVKSAGRTVDWIEVDNHGRASTLGVAPASGNLAQRFDFSISASGGPMASLRLLHNGRVVASSSTSPAVLSVHGRMLGAGRSRLIAEATFPDQSVARSAPIEVDVVNSAGPASGAAPVAYGYTKPMRRDRVAVVELPATFDDDLATATWTITEAPSHATLLGGSGPYRLVRPNASAVAMDEIKFRVDTPSGSSAVATVVLRYKQPVRPQQKP
jgi:uncharacterized protein (TIGR03790 family)